MTGLEKIINKIEQDSAKRCEDIIAAANEQASQITSQAAVDGQTLVAQADDKAKHQVKEINNRAHSAAQLKAKQVVLSTRIESINETIIAAAEAMKQMQAGDYFNSLFALVLKNSMQGEGEMLLSSNDLKRLPPQFETNINEAIKEKGKSIIISNQPAAIDDGFILVYGDIEINCTFNALIEANRDELKEKICDIIF